MWELIWPGLDPGEEGEKEVLGRRMEGWMDGLVGTQLHHYRGEKGCSPPTAPPTAPPTTANEE